jgi:hypothetical protein
MGYLEDLQKGVFLLTDPLSTEHMGRRNRIAKHIKSKADAKEAMLVLCREGKMDLVVARLDMLGRQGRERQSATDGSGQSNISGDVGMRAKVSSRSQSHSIANLF